MWQRTYYATLGVLLFLATWIVATVLFLPRTGNKTNLSHAATTTTNKTKEKKKEGFSLNEQGDDLFCGAIKSKAVSYGDDCNIMRIDNLLCVGDTCVSGEDIRHLVTAEDVVQTEMERVYSELMEMDKASKERLQTALSENVESIRKGALETLNRRADSVVELHELARERDHIVADKTFEASKRTRSRSRPRSTKDHIVAHWKMDSISQGSPPKIRDSSSSGLNMHLEVHGNPRVTEEDGRKAVWLEGGDHYFSLETPTEYLSEASEGFTVSFWYKQTESGPSRYEPFILLYKDEKHFVTVTDHWSDHRVDIKTGNSHWLATTGPTGEGNRWIHCTAVFSPDTVRLVLSEKKVGDRADRTVAYTLSDMKPTEFDKIFVGTGPDWVIPIRDVAPVQAYLSEMRIYSIPFGDEDMKGLLTN